jgi:hypothetical protein
MLPLEISPTHSPDPTEDSREGCCVAGEFNVYWMDADIDDNGNGIDTGWYWGRIGRPSRHEGPFVTSDDAFDDAREECNADRQRIRDQQWARDVWAKLDHDDETRDHYRAKFEQDR